VNIKTLQDKIEQAEKLKDQSLANANAMAGQIAVYREWLADLAAQEVDTPSTVTDPQEA